jgi:tetratricopeptide (TPR) repeat protein
MVLRPSIFALLVISCFATNLPADEVKDAAIKDKAAAQSGNKKAGNKKPDKKADDKKADDKKADDKKADDKKADDKKADDKKADDKKADDKKADDKKADDKKPKGYQLQLLDEPALPFEPVKGRSEEAQRKVDATSWFLTGRLLAHRELYKEALSAYKNSIELNPDRVETYRGMIEVSLHLGDAKQVMEYARKVVELDPEDFTLLRQLGLQMARDGKLPEAIQYLKTARDSSKLKQKSGFFVLVNRDLGLIYDIAGEKEKSADCYEVVFDGLRNPRDYSLDRRTLQELQRNSATSYERIGQVFLNANRLDKAREALEAGLEDKNRKPGSLNLSLAEVYHRSKKEEKALEQLDIFFSSKLRRGKAPYRLLQEVLRELKKEEELLKRIKELAEATPRNKDLQFFLAEVYVGFKRLDDAEKIYRDTLNNGSDAEAYLGLATIYRQQGKSAQLLDSLSKALEQTKQLVKVAEAFEVEMQAIQKDDQLLAALVQLVREETKDNPVPAQFNRIILIAQLTGQAEQYDISSELFRMALQADQGKAERVFSGLASVLMEAERYAEAADVYQEAINHPRAQGNKINNLLSMAFALEMAGKTKEALDAVVQSRALLPQGDAVFDYREAWIYYHSKQYKIAIQKYEAFMVKYPSSRFSRQIKFSLSALYVRVGDMQKGEKILEEFLAENPNDPGVNNDLGYLYADQGKNLEKAKSMIEIAIKAEPENGAYLDSMGWVLYKLGDYEKAAEWLEKASNAENGGDPTIWEHLGDCQHRMKKLDAAKASWQKAFDQTSKDAFPDKKLVDRLKDKLKIKKPE